MTKNSPIEWTDHSFNPWIGCTAVSPACDHCYAERFAKRIGVQWGAHADRRFAAETTWKQPLAWNRRAHREGRRDRVFGPSLADPWDKQVPIAYLTVYLNLIRQCDALDWLLLTKRPQMILPRLRAALDDAMDQSALVRWDTGPVAKWLKRWLGGEPPHNVWLGTTVENQAEADRRIPHLLAVPAAKRFLSCEPLLGPVDLTRITGPNGIQVIDALGGHSRGPEWTAADARIHWVIAGGESGAGARPMHPDWARTLRDQCAAAGVPFFFKQWGQWLTGEEVMFTEEGQQYLDHVLFADGDEVSPSLSDGWDITYDIACRHRGEPKQVWREYFGSGNGQLLKRTSKKAAGRLLDGREHNEVPA